MAWGSNKELEQECANLRAQLEQMKERVKELQEDKADLRSQLGRLQEALIAKEAPQAYIDQKVAEEEAAMEKLSPEEQEYQKELAKANRRLLEQIESPLFTNAENLHDTLSSAILKEELAKVFPSTNRNDGES